MSRTQFLDALKKSWFGGIVCINLYRSTWIETLSQSAVGEYLDRCSLKYLDDLALYPSDPEPEVALRVAISWDTRGPSAACNSFPSPAPDGDPIQFSIVLPVVALWRSASSARCATYAKRRVADGGEFDAVLREWRADGAEWSFGKDRDYFWVASQPDFASLGIKGPSRGLAQCYVDVFGLCHYGRGDALMRAVVPAELVGTAGPLFRPTGFDGLDNPAYRAKSDSENRPPPAQPGITSDISLIRSGAFPAEGQHEWLCKPMTVVATKIAWEFLGQPSEDKCIEDKTFHKQVVKQFVKQAKPKGITLKSVFGYLEGCA